LRREAAPVVEYCVQLKIKYKLNSVNMGIVMVSLLLAVHHTMFYAPVEFLKKVGVNQRDMNQT
jgi:hypothetical protein